MVTWYFFLQVKICCSTKHYDLFWKQWISTSDFMRNKKKVNHRSAQTTIWRFCIVQACLLDFASSGLSYFCWRKRKGHLMLVQMDSFPLWGVISCYLSICNAMCCQETPSVYILLTCCTQPRQLNQEALFSWSQGAGSWELHWSYKGCWKLWWVWTGCTWPTSWATETTSHRLCLQWSPTPRLFVFKRNTQSSDTHSLHRYFCMAIFS